MEPGVYVLSSLVALLLGCSALGAVQGEIRCYCNDASCVSTGYMCKSQMGKCYSLTYEGAPPDVSSAHGCVESLATPHDACTGRGDVYKRGAEGAVGAGPPRDWAPTLMCCTDDMCNYMANIDINIYIQANGTGGHLVNKKTYTRDSTFRYQEERYHHQRKLWFNAAVIAVPIAGGFILVLLVLLAVRMLRNDSRRHRQLLQMRGHHRSLTKAQLYVADHFCSDKNGHQVAHFNAIDCKTNHIYKDVNIKVDCDSHGYEKMSDTSNNTRGSCSSIVMWGKQGTGKTEPASIV